MAKDRGLTTQVKQLSGCLKEPPFTVRKRIMSAVAKVELERTGSLDLFRGSWVGLCGGTHSPSPL